MPLAVELNCGIKQREELVDLDDAAGAAALERLPRAPTSRDIACDEAGVLGLVQDRCQGPQSLAVCGEAAKLGLAWGPIPGAETAEPPYELRPGTGRRGPSDLWERFDTPVGRLNHANAGTDAAAVANAYADVAGAAMALPDAVEAKDRAASRAARRTAGAA